MKKLLFIIIGVILAGSSLSAQGNVEFSGDIETIYAVAAPWTDKDTSAGRFTLGNTSFTGKIDAYYNNSSAYAEASLSYDSISKELELSLGELWLDYTESFWGIRIGRQKAAWGKADGIDITNVLCPSNMNSLAAMVSDDSKLAIDAIRFSLSGNQFTADAYWIPFFTPSINQFVTPETKIQNGEYGLKLSGYFSALDLSLYGFYGWDDIPIMAVNTEYKRMTMIGADAALPIGETVLRLEAAYFPQRHFQKTTGDSEKRNQLSALAGLDWMPSGWTLTAQYYCDTVFGELETLEREEKYTHGATLSISKSLVNETLELSFAGVLGLNDYDSMLSPSIKYSISDQISLGANAYIFVPGPDRDGKYGAYKDLSSICINAKFSF